MCDAFVRPVVIGRGLRVNINEIHIGFETGWRPKQPVVVAALEKLVQQYLMTAMKSPTLLGDAEGQPLRASDGGAIVVNGVSTVTALPNMFSAISGDA